MKTAGAALIAHFGQTLTTIATCWKITRSDGTVLGFTDHDVSLTIDGIKYVASSGYYRTAISNSASMAASSLEVRGFLDADFISESELRNGAYDYAEVEIFAVNWSDLTQGILRLRYGFFGEVIIKPSGLFVVELRSLMTLYSQSVGETIQPECRADLGDERCKVKLIADQRLSNAVYQAGDVVQIPTSSIQHSVRLPILNPNFDWQDFDRLYANSILTDVNVAWVFTDCVISNYPDLARSGSYYVKPTGPAGSFSRNTYPALTTVPGYVTIGAWVKANEPEWEVELVVEFLDSSRSVIATRSTGYNATTVGVWENVFATFNDVDQTNVVYHKKIYRWRPSVANPTPTEPAKIQIDDLEFYIDGYGNWDDGMMNFEDPMISWSGVLNWRRGYTIPGDINLMPEYGLGYLSINGTADQTVQFTGTGIVDSEIDAGNYRFSLNSKVGSTEWGSKVKIDLNFYNSVGTFISTSSTDWFDIRPAGWWHDLKLEGVVPALARSVKIIIYSGSTDERVDVANGGSTAKVDTISLDIVHNQTLTDDLVVYGGGIEYVAQEAGVAGAALPTVTHVVGENISDGSITWVAQASQYTFVGTVGAITKQFEQFTLPDIDAADDWFKWGVLTFLTGNNVGRGVEVISWDNTTKIITLMLPVRLQIEVGDVIRVHSGCNKTRGPNGCGRYANILNYRGEPEVPGTDQYFRVGGTGR